VIGWMRIFRNSTLNRTSNYKIVRPKDLSQFFNQLCNLNGAVDRLAAALGQGGTIGIKAESRTGLLETGLLNIDPLRRTTKTSGSISVN
jgi:hypothetical protein